MNLEDLEKQINKKYGAGSFTTLGGQPEKNITVVSTGSIGLNQALGVGGLPTGRIVEIYGPESSGKTTLAMHVIAEAQKVGKRCAFIDAEHAFDPQYATSVGIDIHNLNFFQPACGEEGLNFAEDLLDSEQFGVIVVDSVAALTPLAEIEGEVGDNKIGLQARMMSQVLRKITAKVSKSDCIFIFINQLREKIGVLYGSPEVTTGGNALKFYASVRLDVRRSITADNSVVVNNEKIGNLTKVIVKKNKVAPPFKDCEFDILYGHGIDKEEELMRLAVKADVIHKAGGWFSYKEVNVAQGKDNLYTTLKDNPELMEEIRKDLIKSYG